MESAVNESIPASPVPAASLPVALAESAECRFRSRGAALGSLSLILLAYLIGVYANSLNREFYIHHSPFFDSCSYYNIMASTITTAREQGIYKSLPIKAATMCLPWLEVAVLAKFSPGLVPITRGTAIWIQITWLIPMLLSLFFYFYALRKHDALVSFAMTIPFVCPAVLWTASGGFSDFRMDMGFYFFFATTGVWFLATLETEKWYPWIVLGLVAGLTVLERATAPVYLAASFGPPMLIRLAFSRCRIKLLMRALVATAIVLMVSGWWFVVNGKYIYYYYHDWNRDSMTNMPFSEAIKHFDFTTTDLGYYVRTACWWIGGIMLLTVTPRALGYRLRKPLQLLKNVNWTALWLGYAPTLMLVAQKSGLNQYVGLPAMFGLIMFPLAMDIRPLPSRRSVWVGVLFCGLTLCLLVNTALSGLQIHTAVPVAPMEAHMPAYKALCDRLIADATAHGKKTALFGGTQLMGLHSVGLGNVLIFDYGFAPLGNELFAGQGIQVQVDSRYQPAVPVEWVDDTMPGDTPQAKVEWLLKHQDEVIEKKAKDACDRVDYIVISNEASAKYAFESEQMRNNFANVTAPALCKRILELGHFEPLGGPIEFSKEEVITLYANRRPAATQPTK